MNDKETLIARLRGQCNHDEAHALLEEAADMLESLAQPAQEQEPVQFKCTVIDDVHPNGIPLEQWAKPQRKPWVDLSPAEIQAVAKQARSKDHAVTLTNKFLKEKNT